MRRRKVNPNLKVVKNRKSQAQKDWEEIEKLRTENAELKSENVKLKKVLEGIAGLLDTDECLERIAQLAVYDAEEALSDQPTGEDKE